MVWKYEETRPNGLHDYVDGNRVCSIAIVDLRVDRVIKFYGERTATFRRNRSYKEVISSYFDPDGQIDPTQAGVDAPIITGVKVFQTKPAGNLNLDQLISIIDKAHTRFPSIPLEVEQKVTGINWRLMPNQAGVYLHESITNSINHLSAEQAEQIIEHSKKLLDVD